MELRYLALQGRQCTAKVWDDATAEVGDIGTDCCGCRFNRCAYALHLHVEQQILVDSRSDAFVDLLNDVGKHSMRCRWSAIWVCQASLFAIKSWRFCWVIDRLVANFPIAMEARCYPSIICVIVLLVSLRVSIHDLSSLLTTPNSLR